jgi:dTMP kinase
MTRPASAKGFWLCVDGVEGSGKSTLVQGLVHHFGAYRVPEFSRTATGQALRESVQHNPHIINRSRFGQSLSFIGDFHETYESFVLPSLESGATVISDRGWLSKYAYQAQVLEGLIENEDLDALLFRLLAVSRMPDMTVHLTCDLATIRARLLRRDGSCDDARLRFIAGAKAKYEHVIALLAERRMPDLRVITLDSTQSADVLREAVFAVGRRGLS